MEGIVYLYQILSMGLKVSPAIWQQFINWVLGSIPLFHHHVAIMDGCLVHSKFADQFSRFKKSFSVFA